MMTRPHYFLYNYLSWFVFFEKKSSTASKCYDATSRSTNSCINSAEDEAGQLRLDVSLFPQLSEL